MTDLYSFLSNCPYQLDTRTSDLGDIIFLEFLVMFLLCILEAGLVLVGI